MIKFVFISLWLFFQFGLNGQLNQRVQEVISSVESENAVFGISVRDGSSAEIYNLNGQSKFIPASTFKLITTLSAIEILGGDMTYETRLGYQGELLKDGTLHGDLVLIGSGDPSFGSNRFEDSKSFEEVLNVIVSAIQTSGITCIDGDVIVYDGIFDRAPIHPSWAWDDLTNYYTSGAWGVNFHDNFYYLRFGRSIHPDQPTEVVSIEPVVPDLSIDNEVQTGPLNSGDNAYLYGHPYQHLRSVKGTIPPGKGLFSIKGAIPDPPLFTAFQMFQKIKSAGIEVQSYKVLRLPTATDIKPLQTFTSSSLEDLAAFANEISENMFCEAFLRTIGTASGKEQGSFESGRRSINAHLDQMGLDQRQIQIEDGSGLSSRNRITPSFMTSFLTQKLKTIGVARLKQLIPKVGEKGSVRSFLKNYQSQQYTWLKSGSINNVLAYAGILETKSGQLVTISIMANGHSSNRKQRKQMEQLFELFYEEL